MSAEARKEQVQQFKLRLPRSDYEALRAVAFATDRSINELIQTAVHEWLNQTGRRTEVRALMEDAISQYQIALDKLADA